MIRRFQKNRRKRVFNLSSSASSISTKNICMLVVFIIIVATCVLTATRTMSKTTRNYVKKSYRKTTVPGSDGIFVTGMRGSGTSELVKMIVNGGLGDIYAGIESEMTDSVSYERIDVLRTNRNVLTESPESNEKNQRRVPKWTKHRSISSQIDTIKVREFNYSATRILQRLNHGIKSYQKKYFTSNALWIMKDSQLGFTMPLWQHLLKGAKSVCVIVYRHPVFLAEYLTMKYIDSGYALEVSEWIEIWVDHVMSTLSVCSSLPTTFVSYKELIESPWNTINQVSKSFQDLGMYGIRRPSRMLIDTITLPNTNDDNNNKVVREWFDSAYMSNEALEIWSALESSRRRQDVRDLLRRPYHRSISINNNLNVQKSKYIKSNNIRSDLYVLILRSVSQLESVIAQVLSLVMSDATRSRLLVMSETTQRDLSKTAIFALYEWFDYGIHIVPSTHDHDHESLKKNNCDLDVQLVLKTMHNRFENKLVNNEIHRIVILPSRNSVVIGPNIESLFLELERSKKPILLEPRVRLGFPLTAIRTKSFLLIDDVCTVDDLYEHYASEQILNVVRTPSNHNPSSDILVMASDFDCTFGGDDDDDGNNADDVGKDRIVCEDNVPEIFFQRNVRHARRWLASKGGQL